MKKVLFILLAGVAVGMLLAPEKGSESWKKLADGLDDVKDRAMDEMNNLVKMGKEIVSKSTQAAAKVSKGW